MDWKARYDKDAPLKPGDRLRLTDGTYVDVNIGETVTILDEPHWNSPDDWVIGVTEKGGKAGIKRVGDVRWERV